MKLKLDPEVRPVVTSALALSGAVGVFALAFGVLAVGAGANVWQAGWTVACFKQNDFGISALFKALEQLACFLKRPSLAHLRSFNSGQ